MNTGSSENLDYMAILRGMTRRHKRLITLTFLVLATPLLTVVFFFSRPLYVSTATIVVEPAILDQTPLFKELARRDTIATHLVLLKSRYFGEGVVEALPRESFEELLTDSQYKDHVLAATNWVKGWMGKPPTILSPQQRAVAELQNARMDFKETHEAPGVLYISASASNPRVAMDLVNTHIQVLLSRARTSNQQEAQKVRELLEKHVQQIREDLTKAEGALTHFQEQKGRLGLGSQAELDLIKLSQNENALAEAQASRDVLLSRIAHLRQGLEGVTARDATGAAASAESLAPFNAFKAAQDRLTRLEAKLASLRDRYTDAHPLVQATQDELTREQARIALLARDLPVAPSSQEANSKQAVPSSPSERAEAQRQLAALQAEESALQGKMQTLTAQVERLRRHLRNLTREEVEYSGVRRSVDSNRNLYSVLSDKLMAARIREQGESATVRIIGPAAYPLQPTQSKTLRQVLMILVVAGGLAFGAAFGIEFWRQPVETEEDVERTTGLPVVGSVGVMKTPMIVKRTQDGGASRQAVSLTTASAADNVHIELYRAIRANVETERLKTPFRSILINSPGPNEGKSTTVLNLAHVFQVYGRRVLIVDADLRRPALHRALSLTNRPGLADFLAGKASFDQVCRVLPSGIAVIPTQSIKEDPAAILAPSHFRQLVTQAGRQFDLVLIDSPPILAVPDILLLVSAVDRVILVVKASSTSKRDLRKAQKLLKKANAHILGVILNQANQRDVDYYHPRYRKYYGSTNGKGFPEVSKHAGILSWRGKK